MTNQPRAVDTCTLCVPIFHSVVLPQVAYYGEPTMAPTLFLKAYLQSTTEEFRRSEDASNIDAKHPAGWLRTKFEKQK